MRSQQHIQSEAVHTPRGQFLIDFRLFFWCALVISSFTWSLEYLVTVLVRWSLTLGELFLNFMGINRLALVEVSQASAAIRSKILSTKLFIMLMAFDRTPVFGWTCECSTLLLLVLIVTFAGFPVGLPTGFLVPSRWKLVLATG